MEQNFVESPYLSDSTKSRPNPAIRNRGSVPQFPEKPPFNLSYNLRIVMSDRAESPQNKRQREGYEHLVMCFMRNTTFMSFDTLGARKPEEWKKFTRYIAYFSSVGEIFRPVISVGFHRCTYTVSWLSYMLDAFQEMTGAKRDLHSRIDEHHKLLRLLHESEEDRVALSSALDREVRDYNRLWYEDVPAILPPQEIRHAILSREIQNHLRSSLWDKQSKLQKLDEPKKELGVNKIIFHTFASMILPTFTVKATMSLSRYIWGSLLPATARRSLIVLPIATGLSLIPFLPSLFDKPVQSIMRGEGIIPDN